MENLVTSMGALSVFVNILRPSFIISFKFQLSLHHLIILLLFLGQGKPLNPHFVLFCQHSQEFTWMIVFILCMDCQEYTFKNRNSFLSNGPLSFRGPLCFPQVGPWGFCLMSTCSMTNAAFDSMEFKPLNLEMETTSFKLWIGRPRILIPIPRINHGTKDIWRDYWSLFYSIMREMFIAIRKLLLEDYFRILMSILRAIYIIG